MFLCSITDLATKTYTKAEGRKRTCHVTKDIQREVDEAHYANKGKKTTGIFLPFLNVENKIILKAVLLCPQHLQMKTVQAPHTKNS